ncbi:MAG: transcriptional regulator GlxA family with amidase domain [Halieaceae bacterium]|jgi:transcriptional regulator GlxA family with amidase domain
MIFTPCREPLHLTIILLPDSNMLALAAAIDPLRMANRFAGETLFSWTIHSPNGERVALTTGLKIDCEPLPLSLHKKVMLVIAGFNLPQHVSRALLHKIGQLGRTASAIGGVDAGGFILARAGLLSGLRATTQWEDLDEMTSKHPEVDVVLDRFVVSGKAFTAGGASPCLDMMLHLIHARCGRELAESVAGGCSYDPIHPAGDPQSLGSVAQLQQRSPKLARAVTLMQTQLEDALPVGEIAARVGLSVRRLEMLFRQVVGQSPASYYRHLRLAEARRMTVDTGLSLQDIAVRCGFNSQSAFSRAFVAAYGLPPSTLRRARPGLRVGMTP